MITAPLGPAVAFPSADKMAVVAVPSAGGDIPHVTVWSVDVWNSRVPELGHKPGKRHQNTTKLEELTIYNLCPIPRIKNRRSVRRKNNNMQSTSRNTERHREFLPPDFWKLVGSGDSDLHLIHQTADGDSRSRRINIFSV